MIMGNSEDFQRQFTCLMKNLLHSAVAETTKLFESTVHEMRTELMRRKQNVCSTQGGCTLNHQGNPCKQDIGIQCGVTSAMVETSRIHASQDEYEDKNRFSDIFPGLLPDGNEQFTLLFIKPEENDMCDYTPACLLPKIPENQPFLVQPLEAPMVNQEAGQFPGSLSAHQGLSDHPFTHIHTTPPPQSAPAETSQSQESNIPASPRASEDLVPDRSEEDPHPVTLSQQLTPTATSSQTDVASGSTSVSPKHVINQSFGDQPRRLSARTSKSVYRRLVTPEKPQLNAEEVPKTNDTCFPTHYNPADANEETDKKSSEHLGRNQLDKIQNDNRQQPATSQRLKNQCEVCELVLSSASALRHHWKVHGAGRDSVCYMCGKIFPNDKSLRSHLLTHTLGKCSDEDDGNDDDEGEASPKREEVVCEINQEIFGIHPNSPQDQPRRLSSRKSKSVYRRPVDLNSPQRSAENFQEAYDTSASTCLSPTKALKKTDSSFKYVGENQLEKNLNHDGDQQGIDQRLKNQCEVCGVVLNSTFALKQHWKVHRSETDYVCYTCGKIFPNVRSLRCHLLTHTLDKSRPCSDDEDVAKTEQTDSKIGQGIFLDQNTHQDQLRRLSARKSKSVYRRPMDLHATQPSIEKTPGVSTYPATTEIHKRRYKKNFGLPRKNTSYKTQRGSIRRHENQCDYCGRILCDPYSLVHHLRIHRGERPFVCDRCGKGYAHQKNLKRHLQTHTLAKRTLYSEVVGVPKAETVDYEIDKHDYPSTSYFPTDAHKQTNNKSPGDPSRSKTSKHECGVCGMVLTSASSLLFHQRAHAERSFSCDQCGKAFSDEHDLKRHIVIHKRDKRHQCLQCGRTFPYRCLLARHQVEHTVEKPFPCGVCGKRFASKVSKAVHARVHKRERPNSCTICNKAFVKRAMLKAHMVTHRGEKPWGCLTCGKHFDCASALKVHERIHTGERPYECKLCSMTFRQSGHLKSHLRTRHGIGNQQSRKSAMFN